MGSYDVKLNELVNAQNTTKDFEASQLESKICNGDATIIKFDDDGNDGLASGKLSIEQCECAVLEKIPVTSNCECSYNCQAHFIYRCKSCKMEKFADSRLLELDCKYLNEKSEEPSIAGTSYQIPDSIVSSNDIQSDHDVDLSTPPLKNTHVTTIAFPSCSCDQRIAHYNELSYQHQKRHYVPKHSAGKKDSWKTNKYICNSIARRNAYLLAKYHAYRPNAIFNQRNVSDNFYSALFAMLCCCFPLGFASLIYSSKVRAYRADGDHVRAQQSSLLGRKLATTGIMLGMLGLACGLFYFLINLNIPYVSVEYSYYIPEYYD